MKKSLVVASMLLLGTSTVLMAAESENEWFVGGEFGGMSLSTKSSITIGTFSLSEKDTLDTTYEAIKVGKYFDYGRVYGTLGYQNEKDDITSVHLGLAYDYMFRNKSAFTPFLGANISYTKATIDDEDIKTLSLDKPKGFNYGLEAGIVYALTKKVELEMGVRYMLSNLEDSETYAPSISAKVESENITQYYLGLNYKF